MEHKEIVEELVKIANKLDDKNKFIEANAITKIAQNYVDLVRDPGQWNDDEVYNPDDINSDTLMSKADDWEDQQKHQDVNDFWDNIHNDMGHNTHDMLHENSDINDDKLQQFIDRLKGAQDGNDQELLINNDPYKDNGGNF